MKEDCKKGNHDLIVILRHRHSWDDSEQVAKWCKYCGAIVVDMEFDCRISPGWIMSMRLPKILTDEKL
jgi:hypothetical protein